MIWYIIITLVISGLIYALTQVRPVPDDDDYKV